MTDLPEFASEYSRAEKIRLSLVIFFVAAGVILLTKFWLRPGIEAFVPTAHCRDVFGIPGINFLFYGIFVALPLIVALVLWLFLGRFGAQVLKDGQFPPFGKKVFRPTRIKRGGMAKFAGYGCLFIPFVCVALAAWGLPQAHKLTLLGPELKRQCGPATIHQP